MILLNYRCLSLNSALNRNFKISSCNIYTSAIKFNLNKRLSENNENLKLSSNNGNNVHSNKKNILKDALYRLPLMRQKQNLFNVINYESNTFRLGVLLVCIFDC